MPMDINQEWLIYEPLYPLTGSADVMADNGAYYNMDSDRAKRLVKLWNAYLGIPNSRIPKKARGVKNRLRTPKK
jgi:hypothetical protein